MKYVPKLPDGSVNQPRESQLKELFILLGGILAILLVTYLLLGFAIDWLVPHVSISMEERMGDLLAENFCEPGEEQDQTLRLMKLHAKLMEKYEGPEYQWRLCVDSSPAINAFAMAGGNIVFYRGLMEEMNDLEIAFVLGHEMGHVVRRHHLRGMGRGLILLAFSMVVLGQDSSVTQMITESLGGMQLYFSRAMETQADLYGLDLLERAYGDGSAAVSAMQLLADKKGKSKFMEFFSTHPLPLNRIENIEKAAVENGK